LLKTQFNRECESQT